MKTLYLNITMDAFTAMVLGEKPIEYRKASKWMRSRLFYKNGLPKQFDRIHFTAGYGKTKPFFICHYKGSISNNCEKQIIDYPSGLSIEISGEHLQIMLGAILEVGNYSFPLNTSHKTFRIVKNLLDNHGIIVSINSITKKRFQVIENYENKKIYTNRHNAKMRLIRILNKKINPNGYGIRKAKKLITKSKIFKINNN